MTGAPNPPVECSPAMLESAEALRAAGFEGFVTVADLARSGCLEVPVARGVLVVVREPADPPRFMPSSPAGRYRGVNPSVKPEVLEKRWVPGAVVLYVAAADGTGVRNQLQQRIKRSIRYGSGAAIGAEGGSTLWQLADHRRLRFAWRAGEGATELAAAMLAAFEARHGAPPFAVARAASENPAPPEAREEDPTR